MQTNILKKKTNIIKDWLVYTIVSAVLISCGTSNSQSEFVKLFPEGIAVFKKDGRIVGVNSDGEIVFETKDTYDGCSQFNEEGLAFVFRDYKCCGIIDKSGKLVIPLDIYLSQTNFSEGPVEASDGTNTFFINSKGQVAFELKHPHNIPVQGIDPLVVAEEDIEYNKAEDGSIWWYNTYMDVDNGDIKLVVDTNTVFSMKYSGARNFSFNRTLVSIDLYRNGRKIGSTHQFLNRNGIPVSKNIDDGAWDYSGGFARISFKEYDCNTGNYKWRIGFIDTLGEEITGWYNSFYSQDFEYDEYGNQKLHGYQDANDFHNGYAAVMENGKWGVINTKAQLVIPYEYDRIGFYEDGLFLVLKGKNCGYIDSVGNVVVPIDYENLGPFVNGIAKAKRRGYYGYIDRKNNIVIPFEYDNALDFDHNIAKVKKHGYDFYINDKGEDINFSPKDYDEVGKLFKGMAIVKKYNQYGVIDYTGKLIIPLEYDNIFIPEEIKKYPNEFKECCFYIEKSGKIGLVDHRNKAIIPIELGLEF